jgi:mannose/fructose/N-acetylgalactosamine-specific phosphotransferase system component IIB
MPVVLLRVDERLIHGQVVVGWSGLHPNRIVVVDDDLAASEWEQELYSLGLPPDLDTSFETVSEARAHAPDWRAGQPRVLVLTRDIETMRRLAADGVLGGLEVNIGGLHHAPGRRQVLPYLFLGPRDREEIRRLRAQGMVVVARDLPHSRRVDLDELLGDAADPEVDR